EAPPGFSPFR
uniref:Nephilakinin-2 n=1 Tax=Trichonephila clavipes TaxID=2585209 RepID=BRK2_TRICX|nr:RecName: Full=Nephilakinin-2; AltName: Full=Nephilakinin-II [Trichonephila clavipes]